MKTFWIGLVAVVFSIALPALVLKVSRRGKEKAATSSIEQILIRCPSEIEAALREPYEQEIHAWAFQLTRQIVADRGGKRMDFFLYKRLVLSALKDRAAAAGIDQAGLALKLAASGEDTSITLRWRDMADKVDPEIEKLFETPIIQKADEDGKTISSGPASPPPSAIAIPAIPAIPAKGDTTAEAGTMSEPMPEEPVKPDEEADGLAAETSHDPEISTDPTTTPEAAPAQLETPLPPEPALTMSPDQLALLTVQASPTSTEPGLLSAPDSDTASRIARDFLNAGSRAAKLALVRSPRLSKQILVDFFWPDPVGPISFSEIREASGRDGSELPLRLFSVIMTDGSERLLPVVTTPNGGPKVDAPAFTRHAPHPMEDMLADPSGAGPCEFRVFLEATGSPLNTFPPDDTMQESGTITVQLSNPDWSSGPLSARVAKQSEAGEAILQLLAEQKNGTPTIDAAGSTGGARAIVTISADETTADSRQVRLERVICTGWIKP